MEVLGPPYDIYESLSHNVKYPNGKYIEINTLALG